MINEIPQDLLLTFALEWPETTWKPHGTMVHQFLHRDCEISWGPPLLLGSLFCFTHICTFQGPLFEKLIFWHILSTFSQRKKEPETSTEGWQDSYSSQQWGTICQLPHLELCQLVSKNGEQRIQDTDSWNAEVAASLYSRKQASGYQKKQENIIDWKTWTIKQLKVDMWSMVYILVYGFRRNNDCFGGHRVPNMRHHYAVRVVHQSGFWGNSRRCICNTLVQRNLGCLSIAGGNTMASNSSWPHSRIPAAFLKDLFNRWSNTQDPLLFTGATLTLHASLSTAMSPGPVGEPSDGQRLIFNRSNRVQDW